IVLSGRRLDGSLAAQLAIVAGLHDFHGGEPGDLGLTRCLGSGGDLRLALLFGAHLCEALLLGGLRLGLGEQATLFGGLLAGDLAFLGGFLASDLAFFRCLGACNLALLGFLGEPYLALLRSLG